MDFGFPFAFPLKPNQTNRYQLKITSEPLPDRSRGDESPVQKARTWRGPAGPPSPVWLGLIASQSSQRSQNQPFTLSCQVKVNMISEKLPAQTAPRQTDFRASLCAASQLRTKRPAGTRPSLCDVRVGPVGLEKRRKDWHL